jgi:hypothetical protein
MHFPSTYKSRLMLVRSGMEGSEGSSGKAGKPGKLKLKTLRIGATIGFRICIWKYK